MDLNNVYTEKSNFCGRFFFRERLSEKDRFVFITTASPEYYVEGKNIISNEVGERN